MILKALLPNWVVLEEIDKEVELGFGFSATSETPEQGYRVAAVSGFDRGIEVGDIVVCDSTPKKKKIKGETFIFEHIDNIIASFKEDEII